MKKVGARKLAETKAEARRLLSAGGNISKVLDYVYKTGYIVGSREALSEIKTVLK